LDRQRDAARVFDLAADLPDGLGAPCDQRDLVARGEALGQGCAETFADSDNDTNLLLWNRSDLCHKGSGPFLELCPGNDIDTTGGSHKIVDHEVVDRYGATNFSHPFPKFLKRS
jgi:hypothetical protein